VNKKKVKSSGSCLLHNKRKIQLGIFCSFTNGLSNTDEAMAYLDRCVTTATFFLNAKTHFMMVKIKFSCSEKNG
jgi:hypothetical protein